MHLVATLEHSQTPRSRGALFNRHPFQNGALFNRRRHMSHSFARDQMGRETDQHISDINIKAYLDERFKNSRDPSVGIALDLIKAMQMFTEDEKNLVRNYLLRCVKGGADLDYAYVAIDVFRESPRQSDTEELLEMFLNGCSGWTQDFRARVAAALRGC